MTFIQSGVFLLTLLVSQASYGIVNIESLRPDEVKKNKKLHSSFALSFKNHRGNIEKTSLGLKFHFGCNHRIFENFVFTQYDFGKTKKVKNINRSLLHFRHIHFNRSFLAPEAYLQLQTDEFKRLSLRTLYGAGIRLRLLPYIEKNKLSSNETQINSSPKNSPQNQIHLRENKSFLKRGLLGLKEKSQSYLGFGFFYSIEERKRNTMSESKRENLRESALRLNTYFSFKIPFTSVFSLHFVTYFQPQLRDFSDYRLLNESSLETQVTRSFSFVITYSLSHDNHPPQEVKKTDMEILSSIKYRF